MCVATSQLTLWQPVTTHESDQTQHFDTKNTRYLLNLRMVAENGGAETSMTLLLRQPYSDSIETCQPVETPINNYKNDIDIRVAAKTPL